MKNNQGRYFGIKYRCGKNDKRRGIAVEMAIITLMLMFALSTILVTVSMINNKSKNSSSEKLTDRLNIDSIGESFVNAIANGYDDDALADWAAQYQSEYTAIASNIDGTATLELFFREISEETDVGGNPIVTESLVLKVTLIQNADKSAYTVSEWAYN